MRIQLIEKVEQGAWSDKPGAELKREQQKELERLRRENASLKTDLEILKKAAVYFAKESK